jgi:hypothetical protein
MTLTTTAAFAAASLVASAALHGPPEANLASSLVIYGPMGAMLIWGAYMAQRVLERIVTKHEAAFDELLKELRRVGHRLNGLERALLAQVISNETTGPEAKRIAQQLLDRSEPQSGKPTDP